MKPLSCDQMCKVLERDDWELVRITKHCNYAKIIEGRKVVVQVPDHGPKTLRPGTQAAILRKARISRERLKELL